MMLSRSQFQPEDSKLVVFNRQRPIRFTKDSLGFQKMQVLDLPLVGLDISFPERVYVLHHPASNRYGCFCHEGVHGLACFTNESGAFRFAEWIDLAGMATKELSFDEAREVAKERPMPVVSLMLLDKIDDPQIHFVR